MDTLRKHGHYRGPSVLPVFAPGMSFLPRPHPTPYHWSAPLSVSLIERITRPGRPGRSRVSSITPRSVCLHATPLTPEERPGVLWGIVGVPAPPYRSVVSRAHAPRCGITPRHTAFARWTWARPLQLRYKARDNLGAPLGSLLLRPAGLQQGPIHQVLVSSSSYRRQIALQPVLRAS